MPVVLNARAVGKRAGFYVGRPTIFGNPFLINGVMSREEVVKRYEEFVMRNPELIDLIKRELRGRDLVCWCAPLPCHADVLLRIANEEDAP